MRFVAALAILLSLAALSGCVTTVYAPPPEFAGNDLYTQVTLKPFRGSQIAYTNFLLNAQHIPAGTPVRVMGLNQKHVALVIGGQTYYLVPEQGRAWNVAEAPVFLAKFFGPRPPALPPGYTKLAVQPTALPDGLTKAQVATALGYPALVSGASTAGMSREEILGASDWTYFLNVWRVRVRVDFEGGRSKFVKFGR